MEYKAFRGALVYVSLVCLASPAFAQAAEVRTGAAAFDDWRADAPGMRRHIRPSDVPAPVTVTDAETSLASNAKVIEPPPGALPKVPDGFAVQVFATGFKQPRTLRIAPNGDIFLSESGTGRVLVFRAGAGGAPAKPEVFAENLDRPYGIVFQPPADPQRVYVAAANQVVRFPYRNGDVKASGPAEVVIGNIPTKRHWTRDLAISQDGNRLFVAIGSASNLSGGMPDLTPEQIRQFEATHGRGAAWGEEENRAVVRVFDPEGKRVRNFATGLRNCSGLAMQPGTDNLWCVVNERDHLGPNVTPDYMARVQEGGFYGWPWYYLGDKEDPALKGKRPDLKGEVRVPEVLIQAHSSALSLAFYDRDAFPAEYRGDAFVALHGSHSRPERTGYKVIRVRMKDGTPNGEYEDFMTGFVVDNDSVWGRLAGMAVTRDGTLLVSDDANGTIFRVTRKASPSSALAGRQPMKIAEALRRPPEEDQFDLHQAFPDLRGPLGEAPALTLRAGRQEPAYGASRLVDPREGPNVRRSFDGLRTILGAGGWLVEAFATRPVETNRYVVDGSTDAAAAFWGVYSLRPRLGCDLGNLDLD